MKRVKLLKGKCISEGVGVVEAVSDAVDETEGEDVVPVLAAEGVAQVDGAVSVIFIAIDTGEVGGEGEKAMPCGKTGAVKDGVVLAMDKVIGHPAIKTAHGLESERGVTGGEEVASKSEVYPISGGIGEASIDEPASGSCFEADIEHDVGEIAFMVEELVRGGDDHVAGIRDRACKSIGMPFVPYFGRSPVGFLKNKKELNGGLILDKGVEEADEIILCLITHIMMILTPKLNEDLRGRQP
jgi:hypothetical protein